MLSETLLLAQNKRLREENEELRETIRQLREDDRPDPLPPGLPHLTRTEEAVLRVLLESHGVVSRERVYALIYEGGEDRSLGIIGVWVMKLRRKLVGSGIEIKTEWGRGFYVERVVEALAA